MKTSFLHELLNGISITSVGKSSKRYLPDSSGIYSKSITKSKQGNLNSVKTKMNMFGRKGDSFAHGIREHGPIAGLLFISTHKVAFCSGKSIKASSPKGEFIRIHYKVSIPHEKIQHINQSQNVKKPSEKYIEIVTVDGFDFWFMGFFNYKKALRYLQHAISLSQNQMEKL
ncbi:GEM-like protein 4-like [Trifolium medium]|uniref:GEM-like protein 4-like n=1 Tax=Trifolium medium TaxID=97028 RepID=A0A392LY58_9FABA|nr:GEM-like protein 4-like [Trifolium medium]